MFRFLKKLLAGLLGFAGWAIESCWDGLRGKSSAAERAQAVEAAAADERAQAKQKADVTHKATMEAIATETLAATVELVEAVKAAPAPQPVDVTSERRARQARFAAEHAQAVEIRSSTWDPDVDDEPELTWRPA